MVTLPTVNALTWRFLLELFACVTVQILWALLWNNLGRRRSARVADERHLHVRYPVYWFAPAAPAPPPPKVEPTWDEEMSPDRSSDGRRPLKGQRGRLGGR